ncbi:ABC transporter substrate-binding protein [Pseudonocardia sp. GCM10023141]|uniref:ABC transporter substrate-binding protein n=1 Tax=Pseudonocardia sp. GCM10023141 TaxID=3252653 RepID=UPI00361A1892
MRARRVGPLRWVAGLAAVMLIVAGCGSGATPAAGGGGSAPGGVRTIKIALGATTAASIPLWVGIDKGIFAKHNLDVQMITLSGTKAPPALASGSVQISDSGISDLAGAIVAGSPITIVGTTYPFQFFRMYGKKGMTSPSQLAGKTIAASSAGSASDTAIESAMAASGLQRGKDYQVTFIGDNGARSAALEQGVVDAIIVSPPTAQLVEQKGFPDIADLISDKAPYGYSSFGVLKSWAADNRAELVDFLSAYAEAVDASRTDTQAASAAATKNLNLTDPAVVADVLKVSVAVMPAFPSTDVATVAATTKLSQNPAVVKADPSSLIDNSFVDEAKKKGTAGGS